MSLQPPRSPFEHLRQNLESTTTRCQECGYINDRTKWNIFARGTEIQFKHTCQMCDAVDTRKLTLK